MMLMHLSIVTADERTKAKREEGGKLLKRGEKEGLLLLLSVGAAFQGLPDWFFLFACFLKKGTKLVLFSF